MRKDFLVIGIVLLIGGVILLGISGIRETKLVARSINDDEIRTHLEAGKYRVYASNFVPEDSPPEIRIYDSYGNLIYEENYASKSDFTVSTAGVYRIHVENMQESNSILELSRILYRFKTLSFLGIPLIAIGIASTVVGIIKPHNVQTSAHRDRVEKEKG